MAEPEADRCDVDEAQEAIGCLVVTGGDAIGILELVEASFDKVAQPIKPAVDGDPELFFSAPTPRIKRFLEFFSAV